MNPDRLQHLLNLVRPRIEKENTRFREAITAEERLVMTLRFLATGETQQSLSFSFRVGKSTICKIISETCVAIYESLKTQYLSCPTSPEDWKRIASKFETDWQFPHVIGAIDGKHIRIECPKNSGTLFHNYKGFFSLVLLAICDSNYCFTLYDVGGYGSNNDSGILANSEMGRQFEEQKLNLPDPDKLLGCNFEPLPYFLLGDEIFPLKSWLLRPYPGRSATEEEERIYNYRQSRARRVIENTFGILSARWRIFQTPIRAKVENAESYVLACLALHNYLRQTNNSAYTPAGFIDSECSNGDIKQGEWQSLVSNDANNGAIQNIRPIRGSRYREECIRMRDDLKDYFSSEYGSVPWQLTYVRRTYKL